MTEQLPLRTRAQVRLALLDDCGCQNTLASAENDACNAGLNRAEINVARSGFSFDAQTSLLIEYVCAAKSADFALLQAIEKRSQSPSLPKGLFDAVGRELAELQII